MKLKKKRQILEKIRKRNVTRILETFVKEFCANSTIHGVRYFTERKRHWSERCWWLIAFSLSLCLCCSSIHHIWTKWHERPVSMIYSEIDTPISAIPFPTVIICPQTKTYKKKLDIFSAYHALQEKKNLTDIELSRMKTLMHICRFPNSDNFEIGEKYVNESFYDILGDMALTLNGTLEKCQWQKEDFDSCSSIFTPILTSDGICFAFNTLNSHEIYTEEMAPNIIFINNNPNVTHWDPDNGYENLVDNNDYPIRIFRARHGSSLRVYPRLLKQNMEYLCQGSSQGFKVILTMPGERPWTATNFFPVPPFEQVEILIETKLTTTSKELLSYEPSQRQCYFSYERKLRFFKFYTQNNCESECISNYTVKQCGCAKFSWPRHKTTRICGAASTNCYKNAERKLYGEDIIAGLKDKNAKQFREKCDCLPACTKITYGADVNRAKFDFTSELHALKISVDEHTDEQSSYLLVSFKEPHVETLIRLPLYTFTDFLAICGGLLGLFLGVSALSIIEFIYYSTLRLYWVLREKKSKNIVPPYMKNALTRRHQTNKRPFTISDIYQAYYLE